MVQHVVTAQNPVRRRLAGDVDALLRERRSYELYGTADQVAEVDKELKRIGHKGKAPAKRAATRERKGGATRKASKK